MKPAITVDGISKCYRIGKTTRPDRNLTENFLYHAGSVVRKLTGRYTATATDEFWALRDVSFQVNPGEVIGFIGRNGAGKSTLLKILSRIVEPTAGTARVRGRLGSLLEVGTGFHHELSGRENIYLNGSVLGMSRREIKAKFDEIVAFADMDKFLDTPVKRYSSGMFVRLAFAIAAHLQPEVLIVDEVLAVGDATFQKKCLGKMKDVSREGRTVLFVSHDMSAVRRLCTRSILLSQGKVMTIGDTDQVINEYLTREAVLTAPGKAIELSDPRRQGLQTARFTDLLFHGDTPTAPVVSGGALHARLGIQSDAELVIDSLAVSISERTGFKLVNADTVRLAKPIRLKPGRNEVDVDIRSLSLQPGGYTLGLWIAQWPDVIYDSIENACDIEVVPNPADGSVKPMADGLVRCDFDVATVSA